MLVYKKASEPKWVNPDGIQYGVNLLRLGGLHIHITFIADKVFSPAEPHTYVSSIVKNYVQRDWKNIR